MDTLWGFISGTFAEFFNAPAMVINDLTGAPTTQGTVDDENYFPEFGSGVSQSIQDVKDALPTESNVVFVVLAIIVILALVAYIEHEA